MIDQVEHTHARGKNQLMINNDLDRIIADTSADDQASIDRLVRELARRGRLRLNHAGALLNKLLVDTTAEIEATAQRIGAEYGLTEVNAEMMLDDDDPFELEVFIGAQHQWTRVDNISRGSGAYVELDEALDESRLREVLEELAGECRADETREIERRAAQDQDTCALLSAREDLRGQVDAAGSIQHLAQLFEAGVPIDELGQCFGAVGRAIYASTQVDAGIDRLKVIAELPDVERDEETNA